MVQKEETELQNHLIAQAKKSLEHQDIFMAKSWFLTASSLFPSSFHIQFERYILAKKEENVIECCKIFTKILSLPENDSLNNEIEQVVDAIQSNFNGPEINFYKKLFQSLIVQQQYMMLLQVANKCNDQTKYCQLMLLIMKKFPDKINEHALELVDIIINEYKFVNLNKNIFSKDYFSKLLIFEVFPLILSEQSNLKLSTKQVEKLLENLFKIYFQQSSIGKVTNEETLKIECQSTMTKIQNKLKEIFNLIRIKMEWEPFSIPEKLSLNTLNEQYDNLIEFYKKDSIQKDQTNFPNGSILDTKIIKQVFYTSFMLFLVYLDNYIKLTVNKLILIQQTNPLNNKNLNTKKRKLHEIKNAPICTNEELQTAFSGTNKFFAFLNQDHLIQQELFRMIDLVGLDKCKSYEIFIIDTYFYRGDNESLLNYFTGKIEYSLKSCVQLVNSSLLTNNYSLTLEYSVKLVNMVSKLQSSESLKANLKKEMILSENEKCQLSFVNYEKADILSFAIHVILKCLDELVLNVTKPTDLGIGHVMVLSQFNWPSNILYFVKSLKLIKSNFATSKFSYSLFMQYILNTDILEEFRALILSENCKTEFSIMKPTETNSKTKTMTTRGVNKNAKEEIKNSLISQMRLSKIKIEDDFFIDFITSELKDFSVKKTMRR